MHHTHKRKRHTPHNNNNISLYKYYCKTPRDFSSSGHTPPASAIKKRFPLRSSLPRRTICGVSWHGRHRTAARDCVPIKQDSNDPVTKLQVFCIRLVEERVVLRLGCRHCPYRTCTSAADGQRRRWGSKNIIYTRGGDKGIFAVWRRVHNHRRSSKSWVRLTSYLLLSARHTSSANCKKRTDNQIKTHHVLSAGFGIVCCNTTRFSINHSRS